MIVSGVEKLVSLDARGKFARTGGFGAIRFAYNYFGYHTKYAGIYSIKHTRKGRALSRMKHYRPTNPRTPLQQAWRAVFTAGRNAYALLSPDDLRLLKRQAMNQRMTKYNLFMSRYLKANRI